MIYLDTSALFPRYIAGDGPDPLVDWAKPGERVLLSDLARVEFRSAIARRLGNRRLSTARGARAIEEFEEESPGYDWVPIEAEVLRRAGTLVERHALRTLDALQLACALVAAGGSPDPLRFGCLDARLNAAARAEGLQILPN